VTEAELGDNPLVGPEELCLYKRGEECLQCVKRCPVSAVSEEGKGIDRKRCWDRLKFNLEKTDAVAPSVIVIIKLLALCIPPPTFCNEFLGGKV
jgi:epoxyqueuosine reductase QueG